MSKLDYFIERYQDNIQKCDLSIGEGWHHLIDSMLTEIRSVLKDHNLPYESVKFVQIKEKFGGLRAYYVTTNCDKEVGSLIAYCVKKFESLSYKTCEICSESATITKDTGWCLTLCDNCKEKNNRK